MNKSYSHLAIIDADPIPYRCSNAAVARNESFETACQYVDNLFYDLINNTGCTEYIAFYTGKNNFRDRIYDGYKEGRNYEDTRKEYFYEVKEYARKKYKIYTVDGIEADDAVLTLHQSYENSVLCSRDKDLNQSLGRRYDHKESKVINVPSPFIALNSKRKLISYGTDTLWVQMLTGDRADGIKGIPGIGPVNAYKILSNSNNHKHTVYKLYIKHYGYRKGREHFITNYKLLKIMKVDKLNRLDIQPIRFYENLINSHDKSGRQDPDLLVPVPPF